VVLQLAHQECARLFGQQGGQRLADGGEFQFRVVEVDSSGRIEERLLSPILTLDSRREGAAP